MSRANREGYVARVVCVREAHRREMLCVLRRRSRNRATAAAGEEDDITAGTALDAVTRKRGAVSRAAGLDVATVRTVNVSSRRTT